MLSFKTKTVILMLYGGARLSQGGLAPAIILFSRNRAIVLETI